MLPVLEQASLLRIFANRREPKLKLAEPQRGKQLQYQ